MIINRTKLNLQLIPLNASKQVSAFLSNLFLGCFFYKRFSLLLCRKINTHFGFNLKLFNTGYSHKRFSFFLCQIVFKRRFTWVFLISSIYYNVKIQHPIAALPFPLEILNWTNYLWMLPYTFYLFLSSSFLKEVFFKKFPTICTTVKIQPLWQLPLYLSANMVCTTLNIHYLRMPSTLLVSAFLPK